jgi:alkaline phosphatase
VARGNPLFGINVNVNKNLSDSNLTYTTLMYSNGPGGLTQIRKHNLTNEITENKDYIQESAVLLEEESHGAEDVPVFASGPMSYLFDGLKIYTFYSKQKI